MSRVELPVIPDTRDRMCWSRGLDNRLRRRWAPPRIEIDLLDPRDGTTAIDMGAGPGYFDEELLHRIGPSGRLWLVDIDSENLDIARERVGRDPRADIVVSSAAGVASIPSGSADRVLMSLVLCCLSDKSGALSEAWRVLRPGGRLLTTFPRSGRRFTLRRRSLKVTRERWKALLAEHAWAELPVRSGWFIERHLLEKPAVQTGSLDSPDLKLGSG